ncbi:hypothetical protein FQN54_007012 [Arachnomyces sp. PD_36]|nr:hypothetical protein FQN54_007012 [Arachnomyces sp. PD_36]
MDTADLPRHRASLQGILGFAHLPVLGADQRAEAKKRLYHILNHFEPAEQGTSQYNRPALARLTYEYARSDESRDIFVRAFFEQMQLRFDGDDPIDFSDKGLENRLHDSVIEFADLLLENFFLPMVAAGKETPQPSPAPLSAIQRAQGGEYEYTGTPDRVSVLRSLCLRRDRHRCVISRKFDRREAVTRFERSGANARDDDNEPLPGESIDSLQVAHILPHCLTQIKKRETELDSTQKAALSILNMFDKGAAHLIDGVDIDGPHNAISLTHLLHEWFGEFQIYFEPIADHSHTYNIKPFVDPWLLNGLIPVTRTLYLAADRSIDPPSPRLLAIHNAIGHILHLSAAGDYIDKILRDREDRGIRSDGSTEIGQLVGLALGRWSGGTVNASA